MGITDSILSEEDFKTLYDEVMGHKFPWYYGRTVYKEVVDNFFLYGWSNIIIMDKEVIYDPNNVIKPLALKALQNAGEDVKDIHRLRIILNTAADKSYTTEAHVDQEYKHKTALLYLNDSDGTTIIYKEKYDPTGDCSNSEAFKNKVLPELTPEVEVEPKANRLFMFNGLQYHAGTVPTKVPRRVIMNINYTVHFKK
jgi:hypothetical protein